MNHVIYRTSIPFKKAVLKTDIDHTTLDIETGTVFVPFKATAESEKPNEENE